MTMDPQTARFVVVVDPFAQASKSAAYFMKDRVTGNLVGPWVEWADADRVVQAENARGEKAAAARWRAEHPAPEPEVPARPADPEGDQVWQRGPGEPRYIVATRKLDGQPYILDRQTKLVRGPWVSWEDADAACANYNAEEERQRSGGQDEEARGRTADPHDEPMIKQWFKRGGGPGR